VIVFFKTLVYSGKKAPKSKHLSGKNALKMQIISMISYAFGGDSNCKVKTVIKVVSWEL